MCGEDGLYLTLPSHPWVRDDFCSCLVVTQPDGTRV